MERKIRHKKLSKRSKHAQQETVGFVLIVMLIVIAAVIFIGLKVRHSSPNIATDAEISNFLAASSELTTECYLNNLPNYRNIKDLKKDCYYSNSAVLCPEGMTACSSLRNIYETLLINFRPGGKFLTYYKLGFYYAPGSSESGGQRIGFGTPIEFGNASLCLSKRGGKTEISANEEGSRIVTEIEVCEEA